MTTKTKSTKASAPAVDANGRKFAHQFATSTAAGLLALRDGIIHAAVTGQAYAPADFTGMTDKTAAKAASWFNRLRGKAKAAGGALALTKALDGAMARAQGDRRQALLDAAGCIRDAIKAAGGKALSAKAVAEAVAEGEAKAAAANEARKAGRAPRQPDGGKAKRGTIVPLRDSQVLAALAQKYAAAKGERAAELAALCEEAADLAKALEGEDAPAAKPAKRGKAK